MHQSILSKKIFYPIILFCKKLIYFIYTLKLRDRSYTYIILKPYTLIREYLKKIKKMFIINLKNSFH